MFVFAIRLVKSDNVHTKLGGVPVIKCCKCNNEMLLEFGEQEVYVSEFQLATLLRVLEKRNHELHKRLSRYYDLISDVALSTGGHHERKLGDNQGSIQSKA